MLWFHPACRREIARLPVEIRCDLADALARLDLGHRLSMPLSRPMPELATSAHELRLRSREGEFRVMYAFLPKDEVAVLHAFKKKTRTTPVLSMEVARRRLRERRS